jgi:hypothetical protein
MLVEAALAPGTMSRFHPPPLEVPMSLRPYASHPARRLRQVVSDVLVVVVLGLLGYVALQVHDAIERLDGPGKELMSAGQGLQDNLGKASDAASEVPVVGDELATPIEEASDAAATVEEAGRRQVNAAHGAANWVGWAVFLLPGLGLLAYWLPRRLGYARLAGHTKQVASSVEGADLLALRALNRQPLHRLQAVSRSPAEEWRRGDAGTIAMLARLELDELGLH